MLGKRCRSIRNIASVMSMGSECAPVDTIVAAPAKQCVENQTSQKSVTTCVHRKVVGFELKHFLEDNEDSKLVATTQSPGEKQNESPKSLRPTSGLEKLLYSPRSTVNKSAQMVGLGFVAALDSGPSDTFEDKDLVSDCCTVARSMAVRCMAHTSCLSESPRIPPRVLGSVFKQSNPIPIAQSPFLQFSVDLKQKNSKDSSICNPLPLEERLRSSRGYTVACGKVERCVFSPLSTSPWADEGAGHLSISAMDFMEACFLCKRKLGQGRDIFMYRGDRAFCSEECRHQQIMNDERAECLGKCSAMALKTGKTVQSRRSSNRTRILAADTAAAA